MKLISGFLKENALNLLKPTREVDDLKYDTNKFSCSVCNYYLPITLFSPLLLLLIL